MEDPDKPEQLNFFAMTKVLKLSNTSQIESEETFGFVGFENIFIRLEIISNGRPLKVLNNSIDISKLKSHNKPTISPDTT